MTDLVSCIFNPLVDCPLAHPWQEIGRRDSAVLPLGRQSIIYGIGGAHLEYHRLPLNRERS